MAMSSCINDSTGFLLVDVDVAQVRPSPPGANFVRFQCIQVINREVPFV